MKPPQKTIYGEMFANTTPTKSDIIAHFNNAYSGLTISTEEGVKTESWLAHPNGCHSINENRYSIKLVCL